jgi:uncharacterized tellurite resistance protein B-like protein
MSFVLKRPDGSNRNVGGYRVSSPRPGTRSFQRDDRISALPPKVDLRPMLTPVENQSSTNSCAANATAGAYEYLMKRHLGEASFDVSRLFIYYNARALEGQEGRDEGTTLGSVIESLRANGACAESTWPFDEGLVNEPPADTAFEEAAQFLIEECEQVTTDLDSWKSALAAGNPIIFGIKLFASFDKHKKPGAVPMPTGSETGRESHGGHAMLCVGYSDADEVFIIRNSWGPSWGDKGYCYMPYAYVMNAELNFGDNWIIKRVEPIPLDENTWGDDSTILPAVETMLGQMDDAAYGSLLEAMGDLSFEERLAHLFLRAAAADGDVSEEEAATAAALLEPVLKQVGSPYDAAAVVSSSLSLLEREDVVDETLSIFKDHLGADGLAAIANQLQEVAAGDGESDEEAAFVNAVVEQWQVA